MKQLYSLFTLMAFTVVAMSQVKIKNSGTSKVSVAICYYANNTGWTSRGWFTVEPDSEKVVYNYKPSMNPNLYYCATIEGCDKGYFGDLPMYVNVKDAFTIPNANKEANYTNPSIRKYNFKQINLKGRDDYTIELQPLNLICNEKKQGKWTFALDKEGEYAEKKEDAVFKREITFNAGEPIGWCRDLYNDGKIKSDFKLTSFNPVIYDGKRTWYRKDGSIEKEILYKKGFSLNETQYNLNGEALSKKAHYKTVELPVQYFYINSTSNETFKDGKSKTVYPIQLPEGTIEWYYEFTASRNEAEVKANAEKFNLASQLTSLIDKTGLLKSSINMLTEAPGGDICNIYLFDSKYYNSFLNATEFRYDVLGSRLNYKSGIVQVKDVRNILTPMIGIKNPDGFNGVHVSLQVVAIVSEID
jgi:uncharacterized membrane protein